MTADTHAPNLFELLTGAECVEAIRKPLSDVRRLSVFRLKCASAVWNTYRGGTITLREIAVAFTVADLVSGAHGLGDGSRTFSR